jgi:hypothetical protein
MRSAAKEASMAFLRAVCSHDMCIKCLQYSERCMCSVICLIVIYNTQKKSIKHVNRRASFNLEQSTRPRTCGQ